MVKTVTTFYADDGKAFDNADDAIKYEFAKKLKQEFGWDDKFCQSILEFGNAGRLVHLLNEYLDNWPRTECS